MNDHDAARLQLTRPATMHATRVATWRRPRAVARVLFAMLAALSTTTVHAACQVESVELPVRMNGVRATATVGINGKSVPMMVDSGAFYSVLTDAAAAQLGLAVTYDRNLRVQGATGRIETRTTIVDHLQLLSRTIDGIEFVVGGNDPGGGAMGIMGRNILSFTDTEYDLAHGVIRFLFPGKACDGANMAYWAGPSPVTVVDLLGEHWSRAPAIRAEVRLNGVELVALFDSGAFATIISERAARRAGIDDAERTPAGSVKGGGRGIAKAWTALFDRFELGGEVVRHSRLLVGDVDAGDADMLLGIDFFLSHRIYVSKQQSKMFVTYNGGPIFTLDRPSAATASAATADAAAVDDAAATADQLARRGAASAARHDYPSALADLDRACALEPTSAALLVQRGDVQRALKRPVLALQDFDRALALDPTRLDAHAGRVGLRLAANDRDGAKADLDALDRGLPPQAQFRLPMSSLYLVLEEPALALSQLNQWLPAHPNEAGREAALSRRCLARVMLDIELEQALDDCDRAVGSDAKNPLYLDARGWANLRLGNDRKAVSDFDHVIEIVPKNASSLYGRGLAKTRLGDAARGDADRAAARAIEADIDLRMARFGLMADTTAKP